MLPCYARMYTRDVWGDRASFTTDQSLDFDLFSCIYIPYEAARHVPSINQIQPSPESSEDDRGALYQHDLNPLWMEPAVASGQLMSIYLTVESTFEQDLENVHIQLYVSDKGQLREIDHRNQPIIKGLNQIAFDFTDFPLEQMAVFYARIDASNHVIEIDEENNLISTAVSPADKCAISMDVSFGYNDWYCASGEGQWVGSAYYRMGLGDRSWLTPITGGYLYYSLIRLSDNVEIDGDMIHTDSNGLWRIDLGLPQDEDGAFYALRLQMTDGFTYEDLNYSFRLTACPNGSHRVLEIPEEANERRDLRP